MPIPESQLETWSHLGATTTAKRTHEAVERALRRHLPVMTYDVYSPNPLLLRQVSFLGGGAYSRSSETVQYEVYLQGSYRNFTNIYADSDVDVVVQLKSDTSSSTSALSDPNKRSCFNRWDAFRCSVHSALVAEFGSGAVSYGDKSIKIARDGGRLPCDVVPCMGHSHHSASIFDFRPTVTGIAFWSQRDQRQIINFPKQHYANGAEKNERTSKRFKPVVRMLKNARKAAVQKGYLTDGVAPSYFEECFVYSAPDSLFRSSLGDSFYKIVSHWRETLQTRNRLATMCLRCQNEVMDLFGYTPEQWSQESAKQLTMGLINLWDNWS